LEELIKTFFSENIFRDNDDEIIANVINKSIDFNLLPKVSADCREAMMLMLERDPTRRISAAELLQHSWIKVC
jgi:serine/threonine protein kinase